MDTHPSFLIDGQEVPFQAGQTVLQAALAAGLNIPHLCFNPELEPIGSCRLCLVEVAGCKLSACTLLAEEGLSIQHDTPRLRQLRMALLTFLLEQGKHTCIRCERTGDCRLQDAAIAFDAQPEAHFASQVFPPNDDSHPDVSLNRDRCILCGICIQASRKLDGKNLFTFAGKGGDMMLTVESPSGLLKDSAISADDHAVRLCPVGALTRKHHPVQASFSSFDGFEGMDWGMPTEFSV